MQKRVVNVYRLITRGTLEEKIMGLQKFKMSIANTVISQDNASLQSMGTDQLLNLFSLDKVTPHTCFREPNSVNSCQDFFFLLILSAVNTVDAQLKEL